MLRGTLRNKVACYDKSSVMTYLQYTHTTASKSFQWKICYYLRRGITGSLSFSQESRLTYLSRTHVFESRLQLVCSNESFSICFYLVRYQYASIVETIQVFDFVQVGFKNYGINLVDSIAILIKKNTETCFENTRKISKHKHLIVFTRHCIKQSKTMIEK